MSDTRPMTPEQAATLKQLAKVAYELDAFKPNLRCAEADIRIAMLKAKLKLRVPVSGQTADPRRGPAHRRESCRSCCASLENTCRAVMSKHRATKECYSALGTCAGKIMSIQRLVVACAAAFAALMSASYAGPCSQGITVCRPNLTPSSKRMLPLGHPHVRALQPQTPRRGR